MIYKLTTFTLLAVFLTVFGLGPLSTASARTISAPTAPAAGPFTNIPVTGTIPSNGGTFTGTMDITNFARQAGSLVANGTISGVLRDASGGLIGNVTDQTVTNIPVAVPERTCQILALDLGPLHLDLLGLVVDLSAIHLRITAVEAPGNLLGNLLCAIAHLLDGPGNPLNAIIQRLNRIIGLLG